MAARMMARFRGVSILYEDNHVLVAVKPPNVPAQADCSGDADMLSLLKGYIAAKYQKPGAVYLGLVHRLDRPVGGLMVFARTSKAAARLSAQVQSKTLFREYVAVVQGDAPAQGELCDWLVKDARTNTVHVASTGAPGAKQAHLTFARVAQDTDGALVRVQLMTGRSHQIRVQLSHAGMPIWGDARYGGGKRGEQIALWGMRLGFEHPTTHEALIFTALPPAKKPPWHRFEDALAAAPGDASDPSSLI